MASSALPVAMAAEVAGVPAFNQLAAKAPTNTPGQSSGPHKSRTAMARPVGGQTGLELTFSVAKSLRLPNATKAYTAERIALATVVRACHVVIIQHRVASIFASID